MNILLAEDHAIVRAGLRWLIAEAYPDAKFGEAGSCNELLAQIDQCRWDVLILDVTIGNRNSLDMVSDILKTRPEIKIVVLSMHDERPFIVQALKAGVLGYLTKDRAPEELLAAIRSVLEGRRYIGETVAAKMADYIAVSGDKAAHEYLSPREYVVFIELASAKSVSEIAETLNLSVKTISTYRSRILEKLDLSSNAELMRYALQHKLVV